jgi:hypothetical protein
LHLAIFMSYASGDVLRKEDDNGTVGLRAAWQHHAQGRRVVVFIDQQLESGRSSQTRQLVRVRQDALISPECGSDQEERASGGSR